MINYVLHASVAAKWFLPTAGETHVSEAQDLLRGYAKGETKFTVPDLFWTEIGYVFWKAARLGRISKAHAGEAVSSMIDRDFSTFPSRPFLEDAFRIATRDSHGHSTIQFMWPSPYVPAKYS